MLSYDLCNSCTQRGCKIEPIKSKMEWVCSKYKKYEEGWKLEEIVHYKKENIAN